MPTINIYVPADVYVWLMKESKKKPGKLAGSILRKAHRLATDGDEEDG